MSKIVLDDIQKEALSRMLDNKRYCLFWDVGVGKTYPVLARLAEFKTPKRVLILAPAMSVKNMWELQRKNDVYGVFDQHNVDLVSFEWLAFRKTEVIKSKYGTTYEKSVANYTKLEKVYDVIILDEAHRVIGPSRTSRIVNKLAHSAKYVYSLTGTPMPNTYPDLYRLFANMGVHPWSYFTYDEFVRYYFKGYNMTLPHITLFKVTGIKPDKEKEFFNKIIEYAMFASKVRTWKLEPINNIYVNPKITPEYIDALKGIYTDYIGEKQTAHQLVSFGMAYRYLNGFQYLMDETGNNRTVEYFDNPKMGDLLRIVTYELTQRNGIIVYYMFKRDAISIRQALDNLNIKHTDDLETARTTAENDKIVYMLQLKRGISINPQDFINVAIFYTYSFSYVDYDQCIGRVDRRGQEASFVRIYRLIFKDTIEERVIIKALERKQGMHHSLKSNATMNNIREEISGYEYFLF